MDQRFDRGLPFLEPLFGFRKLLDMFGGVLKGDARPLGSGTGSSIGATVAGTVFWLARSKVVPRPTLGTGSP